jgi:nucleotide-binding universal stress UspA family protein
MDASLRRLRRCALIWVKRPAFRRFDRGQGDGAQFGAGLSQAHPKERAMFKHILLPTDGSKLSEKAIRQSIRMAKTLNAKVTALHVMPKFRALDMFGADPSNPPTRGEFEQKTAACADNYLAFARKVALAAGVEFDDVRVSGDQPFREIIRTAEKKGCDVILMASHGRRGIEGFLLGSETQKVLTHSTIPVLVYR